MTRQQENPLPSSSDCDEEPLTSLLSENHRGTIVPQWKYWPDKSGNLRKLGPYLSLVLTIHASGDRYQAWFYIGKRGRERTRRRLEKILDVMLETLSTDPDATNHDIALALREVLPWSRQARGRVSRGGDGYE